MEEGAYDASEHQLEYEAVAAQRSIAYSLKRIADALESKDYFDRPLKFMDVLSAIEMNGRS